MTVQESIESAFADVPYPGDDRIAEHQNCPECDDVREHFRGATWRGHTVVELQQYQSVLPLSDSADLGPARDASYKSRRLQPKNSRW